MIATSIRKVGTEQVDAKKRILVTHLDGIEGVGSVQPKRGAEQSLIAIDQFLPADLHRHREFLQITDLHVT